jgi:3-hydroxyisobutyrate dehydrogenase-like beta-hydroxyacid dehydrogenase
MNVGRRTKTMDIGVIGLGGMGLGMAANLLKAGHRVVVWNRSPGPVATLTALGAVAAKSPGDAFRGEATLTMLADDPAVRNVVLDSGALDGARAGLVHVVSATISVALAQELEIRHGDRGLGYVAAPVLGRPDVAEQGQLNVLVAGDEASITKVQPLLDAIGKRSWRVGEAPHQANVAKLQVNFMIAAAIETMAEAFTVAEKSGVNPHFMYELITETLFAAPAYKTYGQFIVDQQFEPAKFKLKLGLKDIRLALAAGEAVDAPAPLAALLRDNFIDAIAHGGADLDWAGLATVARRRAGL